MELREELLLIEIFTENAAAKKREARAVEAIDRAFEDQKRKERRDEEDRQFFDGLMALASEQQITAFRNRLDDYDTATVHALMDNERALDEVRKRREELETSAYRLPDGRAAFKTEDGKRVFDQNGAPLSRETVDPDAIPDNKTKWEPFKAAREQEQTLVQERDELHEFQKKVDDARAAADKGNISAKGLEDLGADLEREMPEAVRRRMPGHEAAPVAAEQPVPGQSQAVRPANAIGAPAR